MLNLHRTIPLNTVKHNERVFLPSGDLIDISAISKLKNKHSENVKVINNV